MALPWPKIFMALPWPKIFMSLKWPKMFMAFQWPKIFMALQWPKILLAPITLNTYALFKMKGSDKQNLLKMEATRQDNKSNA